MIAICEILEKKGCNCFAALFLCWYLGNRICYSRMCSTDQDFQMQCFNPALREISFGRLEYNI